MEFLVLNLVLVWILIIVLIIITAKMTSVMLQVTLINEALKISSKSAELIIGEVSPRIDAKTLNNKHINSDIFAGKKTLLYFVSLQCEACKVNIPKLLKLQKHYSKSLQTYIVSNGSTQATTDWKTRFEDEKEIVLDVPVITAPFDLSDFYLLYNPRGITPYIVAIDEKSIVKHREHLQDWLWVPEFVEGLK